MKWYETEGYTFRVDQLKDEIVFDSGRLERKHVRAVRLLVVYQNNVTAVLHVRAGVQWVLFDTEGYQYDSVLRPQFYGKDALRQLKSMGLGSGATARGWIAFELPREATVSHVQFRSGGMWKKCVNIKLKSLLAGSVEDVVKALKSAEPPPTQSWFSRIFKQDS